MHPDDDEPPVEAENLENFSLKDLYNLPWETLDAKCDFFAPYYRAMVADGFVMRETRGPAAHRMSVCGSPGSDPSEILMFGSNNYLGLANEPSVVERAIEAIREYGAGCGGPPLLNGYTALHRQLEARLAQLKKCDDAILFSSGYSANLGWTTGLLGTGDVLVYDAQNHASLHDGIKLGNFTAVPFRHNDIDDLHRRLMHLRWKHTYTNIIVCAEGVYSMDGDIAPLPGIAKECAKYGAILAIDDAHGTGVTGERGHGTPEHFGLEGQIDIVMGTFSKTFGVTGGFVAARQGIVDYLRFFARSYMFSASLTPPVVASVLAGLDFIEEHPERVQRLRDNVQYMVTGLREAGFDVSCESAIIPLFVPAAVNIRKVIRRLHQEGVFVNGVEYPAVPRDRQRLRISMMATFEKEDLDFAVSKIAAVGREFGFLGDEDPARDD